ncbi:hypothetical protein ACSXBA_12210 [Clostridium perfringens]|uniref:Uncharacterized protein n=5 Tax=Clostridium perfringens TaxID=1502 RepID=B1BPH0_CLOPF|nr:hypothetical protein [Clostridium perfringens]AOY53059.1 Hypothetical protein FORC25_0639 [Clostridium perfringens]EDT16557.1 conserved hypothetical protein [Clostridium perfringens E str. JGS1987]EGS5729766.1 hypothetical protein [Clostridium perfringens]EHK2337477.1 hypothetical protein [Clostridium perfringens]EHK2345168.1 hypothetical protein [Clostridium perfringens]
MKKRSVVVILVILCIFGVIKCSLILDGYMQVKKESEINSEKVELNDKNINKSIKEMLTNLFEIGDAKLDEQEFFETYRKKTFENFYIDYDNENRSYVALLIFRHFFYNLEENRNKESIKTNIKIENIYKLSDNNYEVKFIVEKEFNYKDNPNIIKLEEEYNALIINENNKYLIKEIYNIKDFNNYINKEHKISKYYTKRSKLYSEYLIFKKGQYSNLNEGLDREEILNDGYVI